MRVTTDKKVKEPYIDYDNLIEFDFIDPNLMLNGMDLHPLCETYIKIDIDAYNEALNRLRDINYLLKDPISIMDPPSVRNKLVYDFFTTYTYLEYQLGCIHDFVLSNNGTNNKIGGVNVKW